jgi:hypothetical protein
MEGRLNLDPRISTELEAAWRAADWKRCTEVLRPVVDEHPDGLTPRFLLSCAAQRAGNTGLALLSYEKLITLAVGQGNLFVAIASQCSLDTLRSDATPHSKRYQAMQQWFRALSPRRASKKPGLALAPGMLVKLPPGDFQRIVERSTIELLPLEPSELDSAAELFAVVLHGRVKWTFLPEGEDPMPTVTAEPGDTVAAPEGTGKADRLRLEPEEPSVLLRFPPAAAGALRDLVGREQKAAVAKKRVPIAAPRLVTPSAAPSESTVARPAPEPGAEPLVAVRAPHLRRSEHDLAVEFATGAAELGLAGTRVAPLAGRLLELSPAGMRLDFPRGALRQSRAALEGAMVMVALAMPGDSSPLHLLARVTTLTFEPADAGSVPSAHLALEFAVLLARDRAQLQQALIEAARSGRWLGAELAPAADGGDSADPLDGARRSA